MDENRFAITITAVDKATAAVRKVNKSMSGLLRPMQQIGKQTKSLGSEVWANPMVKGIRSVGKASWWAGSKVAAFVSPFSALAGAGSIAGITALAESWGRAGIQVTYASQRIGMSIGNLQGFRGAAKAAGLSADDMQGSLVTFGDTLQDATQGRNQQALFMLSRLGITLKRDKNGIIDTASAMDDIADAIAKTNNPQVQALIARSFGLEGMLPILRKGSSGLAEYNRIARELGAVDEEAVAANERLGMSFNRLKLAFSGLENRISKGWFGQNLITEIDRLTDAVSGKLGILGGIAQTGTQFGGGGLIGTILNRLYPLDKSPTSETNPSHEASSAGNTVAPMTVPNPALVSASKLADSKFGNLIGRAESGRAGYNSVNRGLAGGYDPGTENLENMTVSQVMESQQSGRFRAAGRWQAMPDTLREASKYLGLSGNEKFDKSTQDRIFEYLVNIKRPEIGNYIYGRSNNAYAALMGGAKEWAGIADPRTGESYYKNVGKNKASVSTEVLLQAMNELRQAIAANTDATKGQQPSVTTVKVEAPAGTKVTQRNSDSGPTRISYSMDGGPV